MEIELIKDRSLSACLQAAYDLLTKNFKQIVKLTWVPVLIAALACALLQTAATTESSAMIGIVAIALIILFASAIVYEAKVYGMFNGAPLNTNIVKSIVIILFVIPWCIVFPLLIIAFPAVCYIIIRYIMQPNEGILQNFGEKFKTGFRHWGFIFGTFIVAALLALIVGWLVSIPMVLLDTVISISTSGADMGDVAGLPSSVFWAGVILNTITMFLTLYIGMFSTFAEFYIYGSVEAREHQKQNLNSFTKDESTENTVY
jgi:hypothetical protein